VHRRQLVGNDFIIKAWVRWRCNRCLRQMRSVGGDRVLFGTDPSDCGLSAVSDRRASVQRPVLKACRRLKSLSALSASEGCWQQRAKMQEAGPHEYQGGSFAMSNLVMFGIDNFDASDQPPHGAFLVWGKA